MARCLRAAHSIPELSADGDTLSQLRDKGAGCQGQRRLIQAHAARRRQSWASSGWLFPAHEYHVLAADPQAQQTRSGR